LCFGLLVALGGGTALDEWARSPTGILVARDGHCSATAARRRQAFPLVSMWAHLRTLRFRDRPHEAHRRQIGRLELRKHS
jgi:hypothetical protein